MLPLITAAIFSFTASSVVSSAFATFTLTEISFPSANAALSSSVRTASATFSLSTSVFGASSAWSTSGLTSPFLKALISFVVRPLFVQLKPAILSNVPIVVSAFHHVSPACTVIACAFVMSKPSGRSDFLIV